ncbi:MAG TPA: carboxypeptidase regulatory-like domain-containing protein [Blastocatellia bacterium]|nr:carboxypeptidase regulatory-like domain-containing protein [Blastocatellia bacterium]
MLKRLGFTILTIVLTALLIVACKPKEKDANGPEQDTSKAKFTPKGDEGTISGAVNFDGTPPAPKRIDMGQDPNCAAVAGDKMTEEYVVTDGKLANVYVYLTGGRIDNFQYDTPPSPVTLDQLGCKYDPHVLGLQTGQTFRVTNSDKATHNVHPTPKSNPEWNLSQPPGAAPIERKFNRPETLIPVKCNQHPWMKAYVGVLAHPFQTVSAKDGSYTIKGVPPGSYTLVAWHESMGEQKQNITVNANGTVTQDFTFKQGVAYAPTSLTVEPALVLP